jgi:hypothetical protein
LKRWRVSSVGRAQLRKSNVRLKNWGCCGPSKALNGQAVSTLILKRASSSRPSGQWNDDDFDVLADSVVVGRIFKANASPIGASWIWTLAFGHHEDRSATHGYAETREAAMAAFAKSWRRE